MAHAFKPSTVSLRAAWFTQGVPGQPGLHKEIQSGKQKENKRTTTIPSKPPPEPSHNLTYQKESIPWQPSRYNFRGIKMLFTANTNKTFLPEIWTQWAHWALSQGGSLLSHIIKNVFKNDFCAGQMAQQVKFLLLTHEELSTAPQNFPEPGVVINT